MIDPQVAEFSRQVQQELAAMGVIGMAVPPRALELAKDLSEMEDYLDMSVTDCAALLCELAAQG